MPREIELIDIEVRRGGAGAGRSQTRCSADLSKPIGKHERWGVGSQLYMDYAIAANMQEEQKENIKWELQCIAPTTLPLAGQSESDICKRADLSIGLPDS